MTAWYLENKSISADIHTNKFKIWNVSITDVEKPFAPTNSIISKMQSTSEHSPELAEIIFKCAIIYVSQSLASASDTAYHGEKFDIMNRLPTCFFYRICEIRKVMRQSSSKCPLRYVQNALLLLPMLIDSPILQMWSSIIFRFRVLVLTELI